MRFSTQDRWFNFRVVVLPIFTLLLLRTKNIRAAPVPSEINAINKSYNPTKVAIYSRDRVPLLHLVKKTHQRRSALEEEGDRISNAQLNLFRIENLDIRNGVLRDMMIKPIAGNDK